MLIFKNATLCTNCAQGYRNNNGQSCIKIDCAGEYGAGCTSCSTTTCLNCASGYRLSGTRCSKIDCVREYGVGCASCDTSGCVSCATGYKKSGSGCVQECTGTLVNGICMKTASSCSGDWRAASESEICSLLASGSLGYSGAIASSGKMITYCKGAGFDIGSTSNTCKEYHEGSNYICDYYKTVQSSYYIYYTCAAYNWISGCVEVSGPGECLECSYYREVSPIVYYECASGYTEDGYDSYTSAISYNCIATYNYVSGATYNKVCIKN